MSKIQKIMSREVLAEGGIPVIQAKLKLDNNLEVEVTIPSNDHRTNYQKVEFYDNDQSRYHGKGVLRPVSFINDLIGPKLVGVSPQKQKEIDGWLLASDSSELRNKLGVNTIYAISMLIAKAGAVDANIPLYSYINNIYNSSYGDSKIVLDKVPTPIITVLSTTEELGVKLDFKEFQIIPTASYQFAKSLEIGTTVATTFRETYNSSTVNSNQDAIETITDTIESLDLKLGQDIFLSLNFMASNYEKSGSYELKDKAQALKISDYLDFVKMIAKKYLPLVLIDPFLPSDWASWKNLNLDLSKETYLVGNELVSSSSKILQKVISEKLCSSFMVNPALVGTITELFEMTTFIRKSGLNYVISSSDHDTSDHSIADLAVGLQPDFVKFGLPTRTENLVKYNRMMEIEEEIKNIK
ncbi:MAG: Enolase [Candidatus Roizmanbacteria bacterium GW2011_GWA2_35_19]|uniref:Enolase n=2 Tax=Candidatus Roizmaniibacteriota TaxID=1752723 RepID=A0A0G0E509_9BACT|nr:MAG: Enolase [Candidatus Roizmanbacteria bacterium GW2011_GWC2_35_12]KKP70435.1 MAG: Enolase [Candidatus Roizmanbacteria bacterium GW2011_GWA2_35_19]